MARIVQLRRATGTIQYGHLDADEYDNLEDYWERLPKLLTDERLSAGAFALEIGSKTNRLHIQFYIEFSDRLRTQTLRNIFDLHLPKHEACFRRVMDAQGSWDYCSGTGRYSDKDNEDTHVFGDPKLFGESKSANLRQMVQMVIEGDTLLEIMKADPYAWTVHRHRIVQFWHDWNGSSPGM